MWAARRPSKPRPPARRRETNSEERKWEAAFSPPVYLDHHRSVSHVGIGSRSSDCPGHRCASNLLRRYSAAPTGSREKVAGVKNLRWRLVQDAIAGTLP